MAAFEDNFTLEIFLNGCFSKTAAKIQSFQKNGYTYFTFLTVMSC